jgi:hypothetical protein
MDPSEQRLANIEGEEVVLRGCKARKLQYNTMAWGAKKTEHAGAKRGSGSFYDRKEEPSAAAVENDVRIANPSSTPKFKETRTKSFSEIPR